MSSESPRPTNINFHQKSRILEISFDSVYSPSAEVRGHGPGQEVLQVGKENVNIEKIEPVGNYAIQLYFDDGHSTGIYSWDTLFNLGVNYEGLWQEYLDRLEKAGKVRKPAQQ